MSEQTKILIIAANPWDSKRLGLDEEYREIKNIWPQAKHREQFVIEHVPAVRETELRQALLDFEPHIVHFSGHGTLVPVYFFWTRTVKRRNLAPAPYPISSRCFPIRFAAWC